VKPRTLAILAAVVALLGALIFFWEKEQPSSDERRELAKKIVPVEAKDLTALEVEWSGRLVRLEREPPAPPPAETAGASAPAPAGVPPPAGKWRLVEPYPGPADSGAVEQLADALTRLESLRTVAEGSRRELGFDPPRGKVSWRTALRSGSFEIGGELPAAQDLLIAAAGSPGFAVVPDSFVAELERPPGDWRSREVVTAERQAIQRITLSPGSGARLVLARSGESLRLEQPVADAVDRDLADQLLSDLTALRIAAFLDPPLEPGAAAGLAAPLGTIELAIEGRAELQRIELGGERAGRRLMRSGGQAFEATTGLAAALARPAVEWRSRHWTRFENWRIERVRVEDAVGSLDLERKDGDWLRDGQRIPFTVASDLLYAVTSAKADRLEEDAADAAVAGKPTLTLRLIDADGGEETLTLHPAVGGAVPARTSGRAVTLHLPESVAAEIGSKLGALRAATPLDAAASPVASGPAGNATPASGE